MGVVCDVELKLTSCFLFKLRPDFPVSFLDPDPRHAAHLVVNHESKRVGHRRFVADFTQNVLAADLQALFNQGSKLRDVLRMADIDLQELLLLVLIVHDRIAVY